MTDPLRDIKGQKLIPDARRISQAAEEKLKDIPNWFDLSSIKFIMEIGGKGKGPTAFFNDGNGNRLELHQDPKDKSKFDVKIKRKGFARATEVELTPETRNKLCEAFKRVPSNSIVVRSFINPPSSKADKIVITLAAQALMKECGITIDDCGIMHFPPGWHTTGGHKIDMYNFFGEITPITEVIKDESVYIEKKDNQLLISLKTNGETEVQIFIDTVNKEIKRS